MTRLGFVVLLAVMCALPAPAAAAQRGGGGHGAGMSQGQRRPPSPPAPRGARPTPNQPPPVAPDINRPSFVLEGLNRPAMPPAGLLGITPPARSPFDARRGSFTRRAGGIPLYGFGYYGDGSAGYADNNAAVAERAAIDESAEGALFLDAMPRDAQVFVDSAYVGTVDDLYANGVRLSRGRHWLELEASGYDKKLVEINIMPGQPLRYRVDLSPARRAALTVIPPRPPETMYAIPGCYGGNKPPVASALPAGCEMANLRVLKPQPRPN